MTNEDKSVLISGMMFNVIFFLAMMLSVFITNAIAIAMVASAATYLFFDRCYYTKKDWMLSANSKQSEITKLFVL